MAEHRYMSPEQATTEEFGSVGACIRDARQSAGLSVRELARRSGVSRRDLTAIEADRRAVPWDALEAIAAACGAELDRVVPTTTPGSLIHSDDGRRGEHPDDAALDALLVEYLSMLSELRNTKVEQVRSLRAEDLEELARALGGAPDLIEARISDLLHTDPSETRELRVAILPSTVGQDPALRTVEDGPS